MKQFYETYLDSQFMPAVSDPLKGVDSRNNSMRDNMVVPIRKIFQSVCDNRVHTNTRVAHILNYLKSLKEI